MLPISTMAVLRSNIRLCQNFVRYSSKMSRLRAHYSEKVEDAVNRQINNELYNSYVYLSMAYHFDRDDIALAKLSKWLKEQSDDEREHAMGLMKYQNTRGGRVQLYDIKKPEQTEWGTTLDALEAVLELEKHNNDQLLELHSIAAECHDIHTTSFLEENYLKQQLEEIENVAKFITNLKRAGPSYDLYGECVLEHFAKLSGVDDPNVPSKATS